MSDGKGTAGRPLLVLDKVRAILDAFTPERPALTLGDLRRATGIPTSTLQRLAANMVEDGFLDRSDDVLRVGVRMLHWSAPALQGIGIVDLAQPILRSLRDETGETACLFRESSGMRVCIAVAESLHPLRRSMSPGETMPISAGSAGRVLLAWNAELADHTLSGELSSFTPSSVVDPADLREHVERARTDGFAVTVGERELGISSVSAPVFGARGELVGALGVLAPTLRLPESATGSAVAAVVAAADALTRLLGGRRTV
ncbi:IclR family transcriptional regulator [Agrococcus jejuensis]|uniref:IclR family transcriptional regulator n=1 Tax=Agrococcus jejuensis TaxID=399736 RepID=UPI001E2E029E|nr:IclR family transcriptional regulator [Agrococcus jejuensis]